MGGSDSEGERQEAERLIPVPRGRLVRVGSSSPGAGRPETLASEAGPFEPEGTPRAADPDQVLELARLLAERIVGHALAVSDEALRHWARCVVDEARGARRVGLFASPEDVDRLRPSLGELAEASGRELTLSEDPELSPGALRVETELGRLDASVEQAIEALTRALRGSGQRF